MQIHQHKIIKVEDNKISLYSPKRFVDLFDPSKCLWSFRDVPNITVMFNTFSKESLKEFSIKSIQDHFSEKWSITYLELWILDLLNFLNLKHSMNRSQVTETAFHIVSTFGKLNIVDLTLIFKRLKHGYYGEFYSSIDGSKILMAFRKYTDERNNVESELKRKVTND